MTAATMTMVDGREFSILNKKMLICTTPPNTNKFWSCTVVRLENPRTGLESVRPWIVIVSWGRVGTVGQIQEKAFDKEHSAMVYMGQRFRDKLNKGYIEATEPELAKVKSVSTAEIEYVETEWDVL